MEYSNTEEIIVMFLFLEKHFETAFHSISQSGLELLSLLSHSPHTPEH